MCPVILKAYSELKNIIALAISATFAILGSRTLLSAGEVPGIYDQSGIVNLDSSLKRLYWASFIPMYRYIFVSTTEIETPFTLMPSGASSKAEHFVNISNPAFVIAYPM